MTKVRPGTSGCPCRNINRDVHLRPGQHTTGWHCGTPTSTVAFERLWNSHRRQGYNRVDRRSTRSELPVIRTEWFFRSGSCEEPTLDGDRQGSQRSTPAVSCRQDARVTETSGSPDPVAQDMCAAGQLRMRSLLSHVTRSGGAHEHSGSAPDQSCPWRRLRLQLAPSVLQQLLAKQPIAQPFQQLLVGNETSDDAAVWKLDDGTCVIATTRFFHADGRRSVRIRTDRRDERNLRRLCHGRLTHHGVGYPRNSSSTNSRPRKPRKS